MHKKVLESHLQSIRAVTTSRGLRQVMMSLLQKLDFAMWLYASENPYSPLALPATLSSGQTTGWMVRYLFKGYQEVDPIVLHCRNENLPLFWDSKVGWEDADCAVQKFMLDVNRHGFGSGVALPLKARNAPVGMLNLASKQSLDDEYKRFAELLPCLTAIGATAHEAMHRILKKSGTSH